VIQDAKITVTYEKNYLHIHYPKGSFMWNDGFIGTTLVLKINRYDLVFDYQDTFTFKAFYYNDIARCFPIT
jgi:uncharacterized protein YijF (DUF1287 family)